MLFQSSNTSNTSASLFEYPNIYLGQSQQNSSIIYFTKYFIIFIFTLTNFKIELSCMEKRTKSMKNYVMFKNINQYTNLGPVISSFRPIYFVSIQILRIHQVLKFFSHISLQEIPFSVGFLRDRLFERRLSDPIY